MKKSILFAMFIGGVFAANAQTATDNVSLSVTLEPIQTLVVTANQKTVDLLYNSVEDYTGGVKSLKADHLTIYSTGGFEVSVNSAEDKLDKGTNTTDMASNTITITPSAGNSPISNNPTYTPQTLTKAAKLLVASGKGGFNKTVTVEYSGKGLETYIDNYEVGKTNKYTTAVTYTIVAK